MARAGGGLGVGGHTDLLGENDSVRVRGAPTSSWPRPRDGSPGWRVPRSRLVLESLALLVIGEGTGKEAPRVPALVRRFGEPGSPAHASVGCACSPPAAVGGDPVLAVPQGLGRPGRSRTLVGAVRAAGRLEQTVDLAPAAGRARMQALPGIGGGRPPRSPRALGDADAVSFGDYHVAQDITWALLGEAHGDDVLAELLGRRRPPVLRAAPAGDDRDRRRGADRGWRRAPTFPADPTGDPASALPSTASCRTCLRSNARQREPLDFSDMSEKWGRSALPHPNRHRVRPTTPTGSSDESRPRPRAPHRAGRHDPAVDRIAPRTTTASGPTPTPSSSPRPTTPPRPPGPREPPPSRRPWTRSRPVRTAPDPGVTPSAARTASAEPVANSPPARSGPVTDLRRPALPSRTRPRRGPARPAPQRPCP